MSADRLCFAWMEPGPDGSGVPFDPAVHTRHDLSIRSLSIRAAEGQAPQARVEVPWAEALALSNGAGAHPRRCWISTVIAGAGDGGVDLVLPLFRGLLRAAPDTEGGAFATLEFECREPDHDLARVEQALAPWRVFPGYEPLLVEEGQENQPDTVLAGWFAHLYVDRCSGAVSVSHDGQGHSTVSWQAEDLDEAVLAVRLSEEPVPSCLEAQITAPWTQAGTGVVDVGALLRRRLGGAIVTLSPSRHFADGWPKPGQGIGENSGWSVEDAALIRLHYPLPNEIEEYQDSIVFDGRHAMTAIYRQWPGHKGIDGTQSPWFKPTPFRSSRYPLHNRAGWTSFIKKHYWPVLKLRWQLKQARREILRVRVQADLQGGVVTTDTAAPIVLTLSDVGAIDTQEQALLSSGPTDCDALWSLFPMEAVPIPGQESDPDAQSSQPDPEAVYRFEEEPPHGLELAPDTQAAPPIGSTLYASYFRTPRGLRSIDHAVQRVAVALARSQRSVEIDLRVPGWNPSICALTTDTSVSVVSPRLPGGAATGKVIAYHLEWSERRRGIAFTMACSLGNGAAYSATPGSPSPPVSDGYAQDYAIGFASDPDALKASGLDDDRALALDYRLPDPDASDDPFRDAHRWTTDSVTTALCWQNLWEEQDAHLWTRYRDFHPTYALREKKTDVAFCMLPLNARDEIVQGLTVHPDVPFGLPPGLILGGA